MKSEHIRMIETVAAGLKQKLDDVVFVGGSVLEFYVDDPALEKPRATDDVDVVVEIAARTRYDQFESELRALGFVNDLTGPACRFVYDEVKMDVIATKENVSGFTNMWYDAGFDKSILKEAGGFKIRIFPIEYFIASKFEAFKNRGGADHMASHDLEDIIYIFDGKNSIENDIMNSDKAVNKYLNSELKNLVMNPQIREIINGHLGYNLFTERVDRIIRIFEKIAA